MNNPKHTKGPWTHTGQNIVNDSDGYRICITYQDGLTNNFANARLIASAPDLVEALDLAVKTLKRCDQTPAVVKTIDYLEARIAKATGGSNE